MAKRPATTFFEFEYKKDKKKIEELGLTYTKQKTAEVKKNPIEDKERKLVPYLVCPICCHNQPLKRTGKWRRTVGKRSFIKGQDKREEHKNKNKEILFRSVKYIPQELDEDGNIIFKETSFGKFDFINSPFISIREAMGGISGLPEVEIITLEQVKNMSAGDKAKIIPIINAIRDSCFRTLELTEGLT